MKRAVLCFLCLVACESGPNVGPSKPEFESCTDPAAAASFDAAERELAAGDRLAALPLLRRVVEACPEFVPGHQRYQDAALALGGDAEEQMRAFYAGMRDTGPSPVVPYLRSRLTQEPSEQIPYLDAAIRRDSSFYFAYYDKARIMRRINRTTEALDLLQHAVAAAPHCPLSNKELAEVLSGLGRASEAADRYKQYLRLVDDDDAAKRAYVRLLVYALGRLDQAVPWVEAMLSKDPADVGALMDKAAIAWRYGRYDEALRTYHEVLRVDPSDPRAVLNIGNLYFDGFADDSVEKRREFWPRARAAYRYFLALGQPAEPFESVSSPDRDVYDSLDVHVFVPSRLARIEALLGPAPNAPARLGDF